MNHYIIVKDEDEMEYTITVNGVHLLIPSTDLTNLEPIEGVEP